MNDIYQPKHPWMKLMEEEKHAPSSGDEDFDQMIDQCISAPTLARGHSLTFNTNPATLQRAESELSTASADGNVMFSLLPTLLRRASSSTIIITKKPSPSSQEVTNKASKTDPSTRKSKRKSLIDSDDDDDDDDKRTVKRSKHVVFEKALKTSGSDDATKKDNEQDCQTHAKTDNLKMESESDTRKKVLAGLPSVTKLHTTGSTSSAASIDFHRSTSSATTVSEASTATVEYLPESSLRPLDVVCGRGEKLCRVHSGNIAFREVIDSYREQYRNAVHRDTKTALVRQIIQQIESKGGRFVKKVKATNGTIEWVQVDDRASREKVGYAIRNEPPMEPAEQIAAKQRKKKRRISEEQAARHSKHQQDLFATQQRIFREYMNHSAKVDDGQGDDFGDN